MDVIPSRGWELRRIALFWGLTVIALAVVAILISWDEFPFTFFAFLETIGFSVLVTVLLLPFFCSWFLYRRVKVKEVSWYILPLGSIISSVLFLFLISVVLVGFSGPNDAGHGIAFVWLALIPLYAMLFVASLIVSLRLRSK